MLFSIDIHAILEFMRLSEDALKIVHSYCWFAGEGLCIAAGMGTDVFTINLVGI